MQEGRYWPVSKLKVSQHLPGKSKTLDKPQSAWSAAGIEPTISRMLSQRSVALILCVFSLQLVWTRFDLVTF